MTTITFWIRKVLIKNCHNIMTTHLLQYVSKLHYGEFRMALAQVPNECYSRSFQRLDIRWWHT